MPWHGCKHAFQGERPAPSGRRARHRASRCVLRVGGFRRPGGQVCRGVRARCQTSPEQPGPGDAARPGPAQLSDVGLPAQCRLPTDAAGDPCPGGQARPSAPRPWRGVPITADRGPDRGQVTRSTSRNA
jgi:hypothetical protein